MSGGHCRLPVFLHRTETGTNIAIFRDVYIWMINLSHKKNLWRLRRVICGKSYLNSESASFERTEEVKFSTWTAYNYLPKSKINFCHQATFRRRCRDITKLLVKPSFDACLLRIEIDKSTVIQNPYTIKANSTIPIMNFSRYLMRP